MNFEINKNIGQKFSLVEIMPEIADLSGVSSTSAVISNASNPFTLTNTSQTTKTLSVIWGDGNSQFVTRTDFEHDFSVSHTYSAIGTYQVYYKFV